MTLYLDTGFLDPVFFLRILLRAHAPRKSAPCGDLLRQRDHPSRYPMLMTVIFHRHCCCRGMKCEQMIILFYTHRRSFRQISPSTPASFSLAPSSAKILTPSRSVLLFAKAGNKKPVCGMPASYSPTVGQTATTRKR